MNDSSKGIKFYQALAIAFIVLRLCGVIEWSWIWVVSPIWVMLIFALLGAILNECNIDKNQ